MAGPNGAGKTTFAREYLDQQEVLNHPEQRPATDMDEWDISGYMVAFASAAGPFEVHFTLAPTACRSR